MGTYLSGSDSPSTNPTNQPTNQEQARLLDCSTARLLVPQHRAPLSTSAWLSDSLFIDCWSVSGGLLDCARFCSFPVPNDPRTILRQPNDSQIVGFYLFVYYFL
jgi:hypothetical protein